MSILVEVRCEMCPTTYRITLGQSRRNQRRICVRCRGRYRASKTIAKRSERLAARGAGVTALADALLGERPNAPQRIKDLLRELVPVDGPLQTACWCHPKAKSGKGADAAGGGYGTVVLAGKKITAHQALYQFFVGPVPDGLELDHLCRVRPCANPLHIEAVTHTENVLRGDHHKRRLTHCPAGHPYSGDNLYINPSGRRLCRECRRQQKRARRQQAKA